MNWQPIETAPKDGTSFIATDGKDWYKVAWLDNRPNNRYPEAYAWSVPESWQDEQDGYYNPDNLTHWQPSPVLPA